MEQGRDRAKSICRSEAEKKAKAEPAKQEARVEPAEQARMKTTRAELKTIRMGLKITRVEQVG